MGSGDLTRARNSTRQRGSESEKATDPGLVTKWFVKEGVDSPPGAVARPMQLQRGGHSSR